jgi:D-alanyl-D-alanine carboxypeptidase
MRKLISAQIKETALKRVTPAIAKSNQRDETQPALANASVASQGNPIDPIQPLSVKAMIFPTAPVQSAPLAPAPVLGHVADSAPQPSAQVAARWLSPEPPADAPISARTSTVIEKSTLPLSRGDDPIISNQPRLVKTITIHTRPVQSASIAPMPEPAPVAAMTPQPSAQVAARWLPSAPPVDQSDNVIASAGPMPIAQTSAALAFSERIKFKPEEIEATKILTGASVELAKVETVSAPVKSHIAAPHAPASAQNAWLIQIGAFDSEDEARQHLSTARLKARDALAAAHPLAERVQKSDKVLYRARFTGFDKETAEVACRQLRRSDMGCIALKN